MAEPHSVIVAAAVTSAIVSAPTMLILGAPVDALAVGLIAAVLVSVRMNKIDNKMRAASAVLMSAMLAGLGSPVLAAWLKSSWLPPEAVVSAETLRLLAALLIGGLAPVIVPIAIRAFSRRIEEEGNK